MIETTVGKLQRHDRVKVSVTSHTEYTVASISGDSRDSMLVNVYVTGWERPLLVTTPETGLWATSMVRKIEVPCLALTHEGGPVTMLHDLASGPKPRGIFCGNCAAAADDEANGF